MTNAAPIRYSVVGDNPLTVDSGLANAATAKPAMPVSVASARSAKRSSASVEADNGRVVRAVIGCSFRGASGGEVQHP